MGLLPNHQNILWFSKGAHFKFNPTFEGYSPSTNIDQILQRRTRNDNNISVYAKGAEGHPVISGHKQGVPLGDVWDIPFLNPKAKERTGYPTQKPLLLLEKIIALVSDKGDTVLDPFFGSGTTLVAAKLLKRQYIGFDISEDAYSIAEQRLAQPIRTDSALLKKGRATYKEADEDALRLLQGVKFFPVHRNKSIDAIIPGDFPTGPLLIKIQKPDETLQDAINTLHRSAEKRQSSQSILIKTHSDLLCIRPTVPPSIRIIEAPGCTLQSLVNRIRAPQRLSKS